MSNYLTTDQLRDLTVHDQEGGKVGSIGQVFVDDTSRRPDWVTVSTGLFGTKETFIPLAGAQVRGLELHVPFTKDVIKDAPRVDADEHLATDQERHLYTHYGLNDPASTDEGPTARSAASPDGGTAQHTNRADGPGGEHELVRSEERLRVGTEERVAGTARLKKVVVTENVTTTIPVTHEEVRVVREPVREGEIAGPGIGEAEATVTLHEERPVVGKEKVAVERVRLETAEVTEEEQVSDTVRKEQIAYEGVTADAESRRDLP
ncbi:YsnF/AvaK domain-containing protein [Streptomyces sp. NPDC101181]|uniref:YsnF/AvaK domain-containing protein n=1 Tax=Streptomyces sp. NPDC101181 TaxID=3366125 RepID=UPI00380BAA2B